MKEKGFTLVEMVISLVILVAIGLVVSVGLNRMFSKNETEDYNGLVNRITSSADVYLSNNSSLTSELYSSRGFIMIKINDLVEEGLLESDLINPKTGEKVGNDELVMVSLDANGSVIFTYPASENRGDYLQALNKVIPYNGTYDCYADLDEVYLGYIDKDGVLQKPYFKDGSGNRKTALIECLTNSIDTTKLGTYEVKYNYVTPDGVTKQATRNFLVQDTEKPKISKFDFSTKPGATVKGTGEWYTALTRIATITDDESGILKVEYCISNTKPCNPTTVDKDFSGVHKTWVVNVKFDANKNARYACVKATDVAGNTETVCDEVNYKVDDTKAVNGSIKFSNTLREWNITKATDNESGIVKHECHYGTSATNLNKVVPASGNKCVMPRSSHQPGIIYYVKLVATNGAGLIFESPVVSGKWTYLMSDAYKDDCSNKVYCKSPETPFYVRYGTQTFVIYNAVNNGDGYRGVLNGAYKQTSYWVPSCDGYKLVSENFAQIYNTTLNSEFIKTLPTNYKNKLNWASWCIGNYTAANKGCGQTITTYIGLVSYYDFANMNTTYNFRAGVGSNYYWLSNYGTYYIPVEYVVEDDSEIDEDADEDSEEEKKPTKTTITVNELNYSYYIASGTTASIQAIHSANTWARPVVEFNKSAEICSGTGTSSSSPYVLC